MFETPRDNILKSIDEPNSFADVFTAEWFDIRRRRRYVRLLEWIRSGRPVAAAPATSRPAAAGTVDAGRFAPGWFAADARAADFDAADDESTVPASLTGLALSGGGIRSATFNLGLLQG